MSFVRDNETTAILAADHNERNKYRLERQRSRDIKSMQSDIAALKASVEEINTVIAHLLKEEK